MHIHFDASLTLDFPEYFDGENDVIFPGICTVSETQPPKSPRKI